MKKLINTTKIVKELLENDPETRNDDYYLWLKVIQITAKENNMPDFTETMSLRFFLASAKYSRFPLYHSVSRVRRKLQAKHNELKGSQKTQAARAEEEAKYKAYARGYGAV